MRKNFREVIQAAKRNGFHVYGMETTGNNHMRIKLCAGDIIVACTPRNMDYSVMRAVRDMKNLARR